MACISPLSLPNPAGEGRITVSCNKCATCLKARRAEWSFRLAEELRVSANGWFIGIDYSDENLIQEDYQDGQYTGMYSIRLHTEHVQKYIKRVRRIKERTVQKYIKDNKAFPDESYIKKVKYFAVGEYGTKSHRPHYHIIIFNIPREIRRKIADSWKYGRTHFGIAEMASIRYTAKYVLKDDSIMLCSRGIGKAYLSKAKWHEENKIEYVTTVDTRTGADIKQKIPRYYQDKIGIHKENINI